MHKLGRFLGWTVGTAFLTPFTPLLLFYALFHDVVPSGNGADAWGTFAAGTCGFIGTAAVVLLSIFAFVNPVAAACLYGLWCVAVAATFS